MAQQWDVGDRVRFKVTVTDLAGVATDPTSITFKIKSPSGTVTSPTVTREATGKYYADFTLTEPGVWQWEWETTGNIELVEGDQRYVYPRRT